MRKFGQWLLANNIYASMLACFCALLPMITLPGDFFASVIVAFVTLRKGAKSGLVVLVWVALPGIAALLLYGLSLFDIILVRCVIVWALALVLRQTGRWSLVTLLLTIIGAAGVAFFHVWMTDPVSYWSAKLAVYFLEVAKSLPGFMPSSDAIKENSALIAGFATGLLAFVVVAGIFLQLLLARWWQALLFNAGGLRKEMLSIRLHPLTGLLVVAALLGGILHVSILIDMIPVLLIPFLVAGLSLMHWWLSHNRQLNWLSFVVYVGFVLFPYVVLPLALYGLADSWVDYRHRYQLKHSNEGV